MARGINLTLGPFGGLEYQPGPSPIRFDGGGENGGGGGGGFNGRRRNRRGGGFGGGRSGGGGAGGGWEYEEKGLKDGCRLVKVGGAMMQVCEEKDDNNSKPSRSDDFKDFLDNTDPSESCSIYMLYFAPRQGNNYKAIKVTGPDTHEKLDYWIGSYEIDITSILDDGSYYWMLANGNLMYLAINKPLKSGETNGGYTQVFFTKNKTFDGYGTIRIEPYAYKDVMTAYLYRPRSIYLAAGRFESINSDQKLTFIDYYASCEQPPPPEPPLSIPRNNNNNMRRRNNNCCDASNAMLKEIYQVLAPPKLLKGNSKKGYAVPKEMLMPGAPPGKYDYTKDYPGILTRLFATVNRYGFDSPLVVTVKDTNKAVEGDQKFEVQFNSLAGAIQSILELLIEAKGDSANRLNIQIRQTYLTIRNYRLNAKIWYRVTAILDGLGIPVKPRNIEVPCDFDPFAGKDFKGFDPTQEKGEDKLDLNDEDSTESLLPELLKNGTFNLSVDNFVQKTLDFRAMILKLLRSK